MELLVVLVLMSIFSAVAFPRLAPQIVSAKTNAGFTSICTMANLTRFRAVQAHREQKMLLDLDRNLLMVEDPDTRTIYGRKALPPGVGLLSVDVNGISRHSGTVAVIFNPDGTSLHARIKLAADEKGAVIVEICGADSQVRML